MAKITIGLCDRQTLIRGALAKLLHSEEDIEVIWSVVDLSEVLEGDAESVPDVVLIDFTRPSPQLIKDVKRYRERYPAVQIVAMTDHGQETCVLFQEQPATLGFAQPRTCCLQQAFMLGARGAVRKTSTHEELLRVIRGVRENMLVVEEPSFSLLLSRLFGAAPAPPRQSNLTDREQEVVRALAKGKSNKEIALELGIREQTVKNHISHILEKLGLQDRLQVVVYVTRHGLIEVDGP